MCPLCPRFSQKVKNQFSEQSFFRKIARKRKKTTFFGIISILKANFNFYLAFSYYIWQFWATSLRRKSTSKLRGQKKNEIFPLLKQRGGGKYDQGCKSFSKVENE